MSIRIETFKHEQSDDRYGFEIFLQGSGEEDVERSEQVYNTDAEARQAGEDHVRLQLYKARRSFPVLLARRRIFTPSVDQKPPDD